MSTLMTPKIKWLSLKSQVAISGPSWKLLWATNLAQILCHLTSSRSKWMLIAAKIRYFANKQFSTSMRCLLNTRRRPTLSQLMYTHCKEWCLLLKLMFRLLISKSRTLTSNKELWDLQLRHLRCLSHFKSLSIQRWRKATKNVKFKWHLTKRRQLYLCCSLKCAEEVRILTTARDNWLSGTTLANWSVCSHQKMKWKFVYRLII